MSSLVDRFNAFRAELTKQEPPYHWFYGYRIPNSRRPNELHIGVTEKFLIQNKGAMGELWEKFYDNKSKAKMMEALGEDFTNYDSEARLYSAKIQNLCGFSGNQIFDKIVYLRQNNGIDKFGRTIKIAADI